MTNTAKKRPTPETVPGRARMVETSTIRLHIYFPAVLSVDPTDGPVAMKGE
jgi:hypothetical protein